MDAIADSSSLIVLARLDALWLLKRVLGVVAILPEVQAETVTAGKAKGYGDALRIEAAIRGGDLVLVQPRQSEQGLALALGQSSSALSYTDCLTVMCARERLWTLIIEDQRARKAAAANGVEYVTLQALPLQGLIVYRLSYQECDDLLIRIGQAMYTDQAIVNAFRAAAREIHRLRTGQTTAKDEGDDSPS